ncbi:MAG: hypothetical protein ACRD0K_25680 [Egibacteraceae bacterium]
MSQPHRSARPHDADVERELPGDRAVEGPRELGRAPIGDLERVWLF